MKIKIGIIGIGMAIERLHYPALCELSDKFEITALCDIDYAKAEAFAKKLNISDNDVYSDYKEMLKRNDITAVLAAVPIEDNYNVHKDVLQSGKNLIAEKPLSSSINGAEELTRIAESKDLFVLVAENIRFDEESIFIRDAIKQNKIGNVEYFILNNIVNFDDDKKKNTFAAKEWRQHPKFEGGIFLDAGVHDSARMRYLFGNVSAISAAGKAMNADHCPYSSIHSLLSFESGIIGHYVYFCEGIETVKPCAGLRIYGTEGEIFLESKLSGEFTISLKDGSTETVQFTPDRGYYNEWAHFYNVLTRAEQSRCSPRLETDDIKLIMNILHSIKHEKRINLG